MSEKTAEKYARPDVQGGYLYSKDEIDYYKQAQQVDVIDNLMLGDFNKKGAYVMDKGIIDELVKLTKIYQYSFGSTTFCQSAIDVGGYGYIDFAIKMRSNKQDGTVSASLQILETIDRANGYYQNTNSATIATYTAKETNTFVVDMLKYFHVISKKEEGLLHTDRKEEDVDLIVMRKKFEMLLKKGAMGKIDEQHEILFKKRMKLLGKSMIGKKVLTDFEKESYKISGWFLKEGMQGYYRYLNQILDGIMEVHQEEILKDVALKAGLNKANEQFAIGMQGMLNKASEMLVLATKDREMMELDKLSKQAKEDTTKEVIKESEEKSVEQNKPQKQPEQKLQTPQKESKVTIVANTDNKVEAKQENSQNKYDVVTNEFGSESNYNKITPSKVQQSEEEMNK